MAKKRSSLKRNRPTAAGKPAQTKIKRPAFGAKANSTFKKGNHSLNPDRIATGGHMRSRATINRLRMYKNFKPIRDSIGKIIKAAPFQERLPSGTVARVEPHRKWFGNTRVVGQEQLQKFQENMGKAMKDPFQVVMKQTKLPISLLAEKAKHQRVHILDTESFEYTFGKKALRKRASVKSENLEALCDDISDRVEVYNENIDRDLCKNAQSDMIENPNPLFKAGQSNRVWGELYKVLDSSDVVVQVIDCRDPIGTRCLHVEEFLRREKPHKHLILTLNKVDLVPTWVTKKWIALFSKELPTVAFHASMQHSFGKGTLINLLRQFARLHKDRQQISVGFIGYPNVGKSSIINTLRAKQVCKTAPIAGETKVWQYVSLMRRIYMIDCPGVVYPKGDSETEIILKGVVRVQNVKDPINHVQGVFDRVKVEHLCKTYSIDSWTNPQDFMTKMCLSMGRLLKGGDPDLQTVAKIILSDFQRGRLPYYVLPPGCENRAADANDDDGIDKGNSNRNLDTNANALETSITDGEEEKNIVTDTSEEKEKDCCIENEEDSMTDIGSTCSGLTDLSDLSDLDVELAAALEGTVDAGADDQTMPKQKVERRRTRGKRAGKKLTEKKKRLKKGQPEFSTVISESTPGVVQFGVPDNGKKNMWRMKLKKRKKVKHQQ